MENKVVFVGDSNSNKSLNLKKLITGITDNNIPRTICASKNVYKNLVIWDIGGTENIKGIADGYLHNVKYCVLFGKNNSWYQKVLLYSPKATLIEFTDFKSLKDILDKIPN